MDAASDQKKQITMEKEGKRCRHKIIPSEEEKKKIHDSRESGVEGNAYFGPTGPPGEGPACYPAPAQTVRAQTAEETPPTPEKLGPRHPRKA